VGLRRYSDGLTQDPPVLPSYQLIGIRNFTVVTWSGRGLAQGPKPQGGIPFYSKE